MGLVACVMGGQADPLSPKRPLAWLLVLVLLRLVLERLVLERLVLVLERLVLLRLVLERMRSSALPRV